MPEHRLNLCAPHYLEWLPRMVQRTIERYSMFGPTDRVLVAISGGKDSLSLWDILIDLGYRTEGLYIHLGIDHERYSSVSLEKVQAYAQARGGLDFQVVDLARSYGRGIPELTRGRRRDRPCAVCGLVKRHIMNRVAYEGEYAAIATGHNLDDEAAGLLANTLHWDLRYLERQAPLLLAAHPRLARKAKPLCQLYERQVAAYALLRGIDYVEDECPYSEGAETLFYKELLNRVEARSRGAKTQFYLQFLRAREAGAFTHDGETAYGNTCEQCGQPTMAPGLCAFCRLWETRT
jgi:tRNA-5-methyluridine54 2-sulfurtransferase